MSSVIILVYKKTKVNTHFLYLITFFLISTYKNHMKKEEQKFTIICIKAPKWLKPFLKLFVKEDK